MWWYLPFPAVVGSGCGRSAGLPPPAPLGPVVPAGLTAAVWLWSVVFSGSVVVVGESATKIDGGYCTTSCVSLGVPVEE